MRPHCAARKTKKYDNLICRTCAANGFSNRKGGQEAYKCELCKKYKGPNQFHKHTRSDAKRYKTKMVCLDCIAKDD